MRSLIVWTLWMGSIIFLIANTPTFFPEWFQAFVWGVGGTAASTLTAYAIHIKIKNDYIEGLENNFNHQNENLKRDIEADQNDHNRCLIRKDEQMKLQEENLRQEYKKEIDTRDIEIQKLENDNKKSEEAYTQTITELKHHHQKELNSLKTKKNIAVTILQDQSHSISKLENQIQELRTRLGEIEPDSIYKNLSNEEFKNKTINHISEIKDFIQKTKLSLEYQRNESNNLMVLAAERRGEGLTPLLKEGHEYWERFNNETLVLRDELLKRLPASFKCQNNEYKKLYEMPYLEPFGLREVEQIAADLERLAENLFINQSSDISSQPSAN